MSRRSSSERSNTATGGARISTTQRDVVPPRATSGTTRPALSAGLLAGFLSLCFGATLAAAAPAAAVADPVRPDARVTHGPSCRPGGLVVEVVGGSAPYAVRLATTRTPTGEDETVVQPGQTVVLRSDDVAPGETIDGRLEYTARDGSGDAFVDELEEYSFTRPTAEDCAAVAAPGSAGGDDESAPVPHVMAGDTVTVAASGFLPTERVTIRLRGSDGVLGSAIAGPDGSVRSEIRIPGGTAAGPATVDLTGEDSAVVAGVQVRVAAADSAVAGDGNGPGDLVALTAAAAALVITVGALVSVEGRRRAKTPLRHA